MSELAEGERVEWPKRTKPDKALIAKGSRSSGRRRPRRPVSSPHLLPHIDGGLAADHRITVRRRTTILMVLVLLALVGLAARLVQVQVVMADRLREIALRQQIAALTLDPHRGRIFDRNGRPLAINVDTTSIYAVPSLIPNPRAFAARIAPAVGERADEIERRMAASGKYFAWVARKVSPEVVARVKALGLGEQIGFLTEDRRAYPNGSLAAHVLGFVGIDNQGLGGVELVYDQLIRGRPGRAVAERDGVGRILVETRRVVASPQDGADLVLTLDQIIQHIAERELDRALERTRAKNGLVLIVDPASGDILALAIRPAFDPNAGGRARPERWLNRALAVTYEPGSTFKIFTAAAALESGKVAPGERFMCSAALRVPGNHVIRNAERVRTGPMTISDAVKNSCNTAIAQIATKVGKEPFDRLIRGFGFGRLTGVDLPGEVPGLVPPPSAWLGPGLQTISFGQGVGVTALQLLTASTAFVNDGRPVRPHILRAVRDAEGRVVKAVGTEALPPAVSAQTAAAVLKMMTRVVAEGTGTLAAIDGYVAAGKTGTAQKPSPTGGYAPGRYIASFLGIVPADDPKLAVLVVLDEPQGIYYGGAVAAPVFRDVAGQTLWYLRIPPAKLLPAQGK